MKINDPYVYLLPNNQSFTIIQNSQGLVLVNLKLIVFNPSVNGNISFYRQSKPTFEFIYPIVTPVSQTKQQSNQQSSTVSQTKQPSNQQSSTVSQTKQPSLTLTNQNLLVSRITPTKKKGISQIIFHRLGAPSLNTSSTNKNLLRPTITPTKTKEIAQTIFRNKNNKSRIPASTIKHINTSRPESIIINKLKLTRR